MTKLPTQEYLHTPLPQELAASYEILSCLKYAKHSGTYLLRAKPTDQKYLLKTATRSIFADMLSNEKYILERLRQASEDAFAAMFPQPVYLAAHSGTTYYIRTYIPGQTLEDLCESRYHKPGIEPATALDCVITLTRLLHRMHSMEPPLIHRDIKPQNVIVDTDGVCHFIDFGISQFYQVKTPHAIEAMGTKLTAPPEQFCRHSTDMRSDLYSLGILFYYCLTGEYKVTEPVLDDLPSHLKHIIRKATRLHPDERYQSADELLADLLNAHTAHT